MPITHILPLCRVYLAGCGCGWMLGETLMESWKREKTQYYKKRGEQEGRSRKGPRAWPHRDLHPLLGQCSIPATLTPQHSSHKNPKAESTCCGRDPVRWKEEISDIKAEPSGWLPYSGDTCTDSG